MKNVTTNYIFIKQNTDPISIEYVEDEREEDRDLQPAFCWNNERYYLDDFIRCHNNPWIGTGDEYPEHIHAFESGNYHDPIFIELVDDAAVNIYLKKEGE